MFQQTTGPLLLIDYAIKILVFLDRKSKIKGSIRSPEAPMPWQLLKLFVPFKLPFAGSY